jgi:hypothetical protein
LRSDPGLIDEEGEPRTRAVSVGESGEPEEYRERVELLELWLPDDGAVLTVPWQGPFRPVKPIVEWDGPVSGPYRRLCYWTVPGQTMPLSPVSNLYDLHELANHMMNKAARQAERQKTIVVVGPGAENDGTRIVTAKDGQVLRVDNPELSQEIKFGGAEQVTLAMALTAKDMFSYQAGNLETLGGLGPQAPTATQERMLAQSSSLRISAMQNKVIEFTTCCLRDLAWYIYTDPFREYQVQHQIPGTDLRAPVSFGPEDRGADFFNFNFEILPYSMQYKTPQERLGQIMQIVTQVLLPMGVPLNAPELLKLIGRYGDLPELEDVIDMQGDLTGEAAQDERGRRPNVTHRTNERISRPGATNQGRDRALAETLLGRQAQPAELASVLRPAS